MNASDPLEVELLATDDQRRLAEATATAKPLPASAVEECVDLLERQHRITVTDHQAFRASITTAHQVDPIDELVAEIRKANREDEP